MTQHNLVKSVASCIKSYGLIASHSDRIYVALSGGSDSVALLLTLIELGYRPQALHCNFHLRGAESDQDTLFVERLCREQNVPLKIKHFDTTSYAQQKHISIEMAARQLRYDWFAEIIAQASESQSTYIAIAHNAQDNVETMLLNLSKGTSIRGLSGMPHQRHDHIIRPMLEAYPQDIKDYLQHRRQSWREDSSNTETIYQRNFIRHHLIPQLEQLNPSFLKSAERTIQHLSGVEAFFLESIQRHKQAVLTPQGAIQIPLLLASPNAEVLLFELLYPLGFSSEQCLHIAQVLPTLPSGKFFDSPTHRLSRAWDLLTLEALTPTNHCPKPLVFSPQETPQGKLTLPDGTELSWRLIPTQDLPHFPNLRQLNLSPQEVLLSWDKLQTDSPQLTLRTPQQGDRIKPLGMAQGSKLLSRVFIDKRIPINEREKTPLLCTMDNSPLWLVGLSSSHSYRLTLETKTALHLSHSNPKE